jgi:hypothetical protein
MHPEGTAMSAPTLLTPLADALDLLLADHDTPCLAVGVAEQDGTVELAIRPLAHHPADELLGVEAPPEWIAFGVAARGRTVAWPGPDLAPTGPTAPAPGTPVRVAHLISRDGRAVTRLVDDDGRRHELGAETMGLVPDLCRRVLGLPTEEPLETPLRYWAARWLTDVLDIVGEAALPGPGWSAVAACHPAVAAVAEIDPELAAVAADHLVVAAESLARAQPWPELHRRWSTRGSGGHAGLTPRQVGWMDAGMLARWCLALTPELDELADAARGLLADPVARAVDQALDAWGLLDGAGPSSTGTAAYDPTQ